MILYLFLRFLAKLETFWDYPPLVRHGHCSRWNTFGIFEDDGVLIMLMNAKGNSQWCLDLKYFPHQINGINPKNVFKKSTLGNSLRFTSSVEIHAPSFSYILKALPFSNDQKRIRGARKINLFTILVELCYYDSQSFCSKKGSFS